MKRLNVLIFCECSGEIRKAFRDLGHNAWSCDVKPAEDEPSAEWLDDHPEYEHPHFREDAFDVIKRGVATMESLGSSWPDGREPWDLLIGHPPCTRLCNSGVLRLYRGGKKAGGIDLDKWVDMRDAALFFRRCITDSGNIPLCLENPTMHGYARDYIGCDAMDMQSIQPYQFGSDASKRTVLWLRGLPRLTVNPADYIAPRMVNGRPRWANQTDSGQNRLGPSEHRAADRARTYPGIARAMAVQWSEYLAP